MGEEPRMIPNGLCCRYKPREVLRETGAAEAGRFREGKGVHPLYPRIEEPPLTHSVPICVE